MCFGQVRINSLLEASFIQKPCSSSSAVGCWPWVPGHHAGITANWYNIAKRQWHAAILIRKSYAKLFLHSQNRNPIFASCLPDSDINQFNLFTYPQSRAILFALGICLVYSSLIWGGGFCALLKNCYKASWENTVLLLGKKSETYVVCFVEH